MANKIFRIDWYPNKSYMGYSRLNVEQIGVLAQIINLIYIRNGPIENDERFIGKSCNLTKKKTRKIINELLTLNEIYLTDEGNIYHATCESALEETRDRIENYSKNGEKGAKARWKKEENQTAGYDEAIRRNMASTNNNTNNETPTSSSIQPRRENKYNIDHLLSDEARRQARECARGYDQQVLMRRYNERINQGVIVPPMNPNLAYPMWCKRVTTDK